MAFPLSGEEHLAIKNMIESQVELIVSAAVLFEGAIISFPRPKQHTSSISWLWWKKIRPESGECQYDCGFLTNKGRFVDREEAGRIVQASGQGTPRLDETNPRQLLFSEDLWNPKDDEEMGPLSPNDIW